MFVWKGVKFASFLDVKMDYSKTGQFRQKLRLRVRFGVAERCAETPHCEQKQ